MATAPQRRVEATAEEIEQSQRSTGRAMGGRLKMGPIIAGAQTRSSIPTKFETILNTGTRERDGFLRRTHRFDDPENDLPGPGAYKTANAAQTNLVRDSNGLYTSKRGTAGFASNNKRFSDLPRPLFVTPGPGNYEPNETYVQKKSAGIAFAGPTLRRPGTEDIVATHRKQPGPGEYNVLSPEKVRGAASAVFASKTSRQGQDKATDLGPGAYHDGVEAHLSIAASTAPVRPPPQTQLVGAMPGAGVPPPGALRTVQGSAVFKSHTGRDGRAERSDEMIDPKNLPPMPTVGFSHTARDTSPTRQADTVAAAPSGNRPSSMFAPTALDRFGNNIIKYSQSAAPTPGPGSYHNSRAGGKMLIGSSWAMSGQARFQDAAAAEKWKPPGPAFYDSGKNAKGSFHFNSKRKWV